MKFTRRSALVSLLLVAIAALSITACELGTRSPEPGFRPVDLAASQTTVASEQSGTSAESQNQKSIIPQLFESAANFPEAGQRQSWLRVASTVTLRLLFAALLASLLAFRPLRYTPWIRRNPYVAETQILLAVVASALMMIVADNAARAFGIFAAASLVRFRTNIRDPKETTVLLANLAIGLATGVGRWELAAILSVFVLAALWLLEYFESRQVVRSMQLKVKTLNVAQTDEVLREVFARHKLTAEVREFNREDEENRIGRIVYYVTVGRHVSTDQLSEEILSADSQNIDTVEWHQKKSVSYTYR